MAIDSFRWSGCGDFILTISIAFFYPFGLTSIVMLQSEDSAEQKVLYKRLDL